jgi:TetR/AcrR family transcriptional regulator
MSSGEIESKDKIILAAKGEFAEKGFNGTRLDAIAKRAGVNKALIHYYFGGKDELYRQVRMRVLGLGTRKEMLIYLPQMNLAPPQKLYIMLYFLVRLFQQIKDRDIFRIFFWEIVEGNTLHEEAMREHRIPQAKLVADIIREGIASGDFETPDPRLFTMFIFSFLDIHMLESEIHSDRGLFRELYGDTDDAAVLDFIMQVTFKGLGVSKKTSVPLVPRDLVQIVDQLIDSVVKNIGEGFSQAAFEKLKELLGK